MGRRVRSSTTRTAGTVGRTVLLSRLCDSVVMTTDREGDSCSSSSSPRLGWWTSCGRDRGTRRGRIDRLTQGVKTTTNQARATDCLTFIFTFLLLLLSGHRWRQLRSNSRQNDTHIRHSPLYSNTYWDLLNSLFIEEDLRISRQILPILKNLYIADKFYLPPLCVPAHRAWLIDWSLLKYIITNVDAQTAITTWQNNIQKNASQTIKSS